MKTSTRIRSKTGRDALPRVPFSAARNTAAFLLSKTLALAATWLACAAFNPAAAQVERLAPLFDDQTFAVIGLDVAKVDVAATFSIGLELVRQNLGEDAVPPAILAQVNQAQSSCEKWAKEFRQAGGQTIWWIGSVYDLPFFFAAIPLGAGADRTALENLARAMTKELRIANVECQVKENLLVVAGKETLARLVALKSVARPAFQSAETAAADAPCKLLVAPAPDQLRVIEEMLPELQIPGQTISTRVVLRGLTWAAIGFKPPPQMACRYTIQARDEGSALAFREFLNTLKAFAVSQMGKKELATSLDAFLTGLWPSVDRDQLTRSLNEAAIRKLADDAAHPLAEVMGQARGRALAIQSMNNVKQIMLACLMYENDKKAWPEKLAALTQEKLLPDAKLLVNPRNDQLPVGYTYLRPSKAWQKLPAAEQVVVYESHEVWPVHGGICIGFLDGHAEVVARESRFSQLLSASKQRLAQP